MLSIVPEEDIIPILQLIPAEDIIPITNIEGIWRINGNKK